MSDDKPPLDKWRLDEVLQANHTVKLWGLPSIAAFLGVSEATVRRWAKKPEVPIYKPLGVSLYCAWGSELRRWQRAKSDLTD